MTLAGTTAGGITALIFFLFVLYGIPLIAIVSICRNLRGGMRIFWVVLIIVAHLLIPIIGIFIALMYLIFKRRFVDWQR